MVKPIYYYIDHTSRFEHNSGIQRCVRTIAKSLIELSVPLIPVVWDRKNQKLKPADQRALKNLSKCNGPVDTSWSAWIDPSSSLGSWILIVELVSGPHNPTYTQLAKAAAFLRFAWILHDAIPLYWSKFQCCLQCCLRPLYSLRNKSRSLLVLPSFLARRHRC